MLPYFTRITNIENIDYFFLNIAMYTVNIAKKKGGSSISTFELIEKQFLFTKSETKTGKTKSLMFKLTICGKNGEQCDLWSLAQ